jgi:phage tail sheath gpL-like
MGISQAFGTNRVARGTAIETLFEAQQPGEPKGRPVNIAVAAIPAADKTLPTDGIQVTSLAQVATLAGYDSTAYNIIKELIPVDRLGVGDIPITLYPVAVTTGAQAAGTITPTGAGTKVETYVIKAGNKPSLDIVTAVGETVETFIDKAVAAIQGQLDMPITATDGATVLNCEVGFEGSAGDLVGLTIDSPDDAEFSFAIVQPTGGSGTISLSGVWAQFNDTWHSHVINGVGDTDGTYLDSAANNNELRWAPEVYKPYKFYTGTNEATLATVTAITDARTTDRTNSIQHNPASGDMPWVIAARQVAMKTRIANADPAMDYCLTPCAGLTVGTAASQLDSAARQDAVTKGLSTVEIVGGVVNVSDSIMCYHPAGEDPPAYRYDNDIEKLSAMIYNLDLIFNNASDSGNPLVPSAQATTNPNARKPSYFLKKVFTLFDGAALAGIITDVDYAKANTQIVISETNNRRLEALIVYKVAGNLNVISVTQKWSFGGGAV